MIKKLILQNVALLILKNLYYFDWSLFNSDLYVYSQFNLMKYACCTAPSVTKRLKLQFIALLEKKYLTLLPVLIILTGKVYCLWFKGTFSKNVVGVKLVVMKVWKIEKTPKSYKMLCSLSKKENITTRWVKFQGGSPHWWFKQKAWLLNLGNGAFVSGSAAKKMRTNIYSSVENYWILCDLDLYADL